MDATQELLEQGYKIIEMLGAQKALELETRELMRNEYGDTLLVVTTQRDMLQAEAETLLAERDAARAEATELRAWIIEADAAYNVDGKPAASLDECAGLVRMCHEGAKALHEVEELRAQLRGAYRRVDIPSDEPVTHVGLYVLRWTADMPAPTVGFVPVNTGDN